MFLNSNIMKQKVASRGMGVMHLKTSVLKSESKVSSPKESDNSTSNTWFSAPWLHVRHLPEKSAVDPEQPHCTDIK